MAEKQVVSVLAFEKKLVPSDGYLYGTCWSDRASIEPLVIREKSVRGTISNKLKDTTLNDPMKISTEIQNANPQTVDCCYLKENQDSLVVRFTLKVLGGLETPSACNNYAFLDQYKKKVKEYKEQFGFKELAFRYAYNIAAARFLWRNRLGSEDIEVIVRDCKDDMNWTFVAKDYSIRGFDESKRVDLNSFSQRIATALSGNSSSLFEIECIARIGKAQEVFPSEEMVMDKEKNDKSKILYSVGECAAFHSQKIGNAIRSIDTWYPKYSTPEGVGPIAIDSYGPVTTLGMAFRADGKTDFYSIMDSYIWEDEASEEQKHFFMAMIIRGGVFGESEKKDKK